MQGNTYYFLQSAINRPKGVIVCSTRPYSKNLEEQYNLLLEEQPLWKKDTEEDI